MDAFLTIAHTPATQLSDAQREQAIAARRAEVLAEKSRDNLERSSLWIDRKINPIDPHRIITSAQQATLKELLQATLEASGEDSIAAWQIFSHEAASFIEQSTVKKAALNEWLETEASDEARLNGTNIRTPEKEKRAPKAPAEPTEARSWKKDIASRVGPTNKGARHAKEYYGGVLKGLNGHGTPETQALYTSWQRLVSQLDHVTQLVPVFESMGHSYSKSAIIGSYNRLIDKNHPTVSGMFDKIAAQPDLFFDAIEREIKRPLNVDRAELIGAIDPAKQSIDAMKAKNPTGRGRG